MNTEAPVKPSDVKKVDTDLPNTNVKKSDTDFSEANIKKLLEKDIDPQKTDIDKADPPKDPQVANGEKPPKSEVLEDSPDLKDKDLDNFKKYEDDVDASTKKKMEDDADAEVEKGKDHDSKAKALVMARIIAKTNDQIDTPVSLLMGELAPLNTMKGVDGFGSREKGNGVFRIIMFGCEHEVEDPYNIEENNENEKDNQETNKETQNDKSEELENNKETDKIEENSLRAPRDWTHLKISSRHFPENVSIPKKTGNTMFTVSKNEIKKDLQEIHELGDAIRKGDMFHTSSGRVYGIHNGSIHPISGPGTINITSVEYNVLITSKKRGLIDAKYQLNKLVEKNIINQEQSQRTLFLLSKMND